MAGIDEVLERLVTDPTFRAQLAADPTRALAGYTLAAADLDLLAARLSTDKGASGWVEPRINQTALAGLVLESVTAGQDAQAGDDGDSALVDAATPVGGSDLEYPAPPHPADTALLSDVEEWCGRVGSGHPVGAAELGEALGIGSDDLAARVLGAFDGAGDGWTSDDVRDAVRQLAFGSDHDKLAFAFRLHDHDSDGFLRRSELVEMITLGLSEDNAAVPAGEPERLADDLVRHAGQQRVGQVAFDEFEPAVLRSPVLLELTTHSVARWLAPNEDVIARLAHPRTRRMRARRLLQNRAMAVALLAIWAGANVALFANAVHTYAGEGELVQVARGAGACLNLNGALILVPMMRRLLTHVRRTPVLRALPIDDAVEFHRLVGSAMFAFALVHTVAHVINYAVTPEMTVFAQLLTTMVGLSGLVLLVVFTVMWVCARPRLRRSARFELFYGTHLLYLAWFALALVHAPNFWMWVTVPLAGFAVEQVLRHARRFGAVDVVAGHALRSGVTRLSIDRPAGFSQRAGDYLFLRIPAIAGHEWHPFTISSAPERNRLNVHVRALGGWTSSLRRAVEQRHARRRDDPLIAHVDGPYGAPATHIVESRHAVLIGAGIGVTPFASVLESIIARANAGDADPVQLRTLNFFWLNRDLYSFEWFAELLAAIDRIDHGRLVRTHLFLTGERGDPAAATRQLSRRIARIAGTPASDLRLRLRLGRPDWAAELGEIARQCAPDSVDVFFCGPPGLARTLRRTCVELGLPFRQERF